MFFYRNFFKVIKILVLLTAITMTINLPKTNYREIDFFFFMSFFNNIFYTTLGAPLFYFVYIEYIIWLNYSYVDNIPNGSLPNNIYLSVLRLDSILKYTR